MDMRPAAEIEKWGGMIEDYLQSRAQLRQVILLVDSRHQPTTDDHIMLDWIREYTQDGVIVIATKTDKLKKRELEKNLHMIWKDLELGEEDILVPFSTKTDEGKITVWDMIQLMLQD